MSVVSKSYAVPFCRYDANTECSNIYIVAFYLIRRWIPVGRSLRGGGCIKTKNGEVSFSVSYAVRDSNPGPID